MYGINKEPSKVVIPNLLWISVPFLGDTNLTLNLLITPKLKINPPVVVLYVKVAVVKAGIELSFISACTLLATSVKDNEPVKSTVYFQPFH